MDISLENATRATNIDDLSDTITTSIHKCSNSVILKRNNPKDDKPWIDEEFLRIVETRNKCKKKEERLKLNNEVNAYRDKIKNEYYGKKATAINNASESRDVEEEFRLAKNYTALNKSRQMLIEPTKLKDHL